MTRQIAVLLISACVAFGQTKKIVVVGLDQPGQVDVFHDNGLAGLKTVSPNARVVGVGRAEVSREIVDADALICEGLTADQFRAARQLKWVQTYSAGVEHVAPILKGTDVTLTNCKIVQGPPIADHAMALLLALTRGLDRTIPARTKEVLPRDVGGLFHLVELGGKTAVVVGLGGIGTQIAVRAHAFGMTIIGVDPKDIPFLPFVSRVVRPEQIDEVLPLADVVFISAPHTPQSEGMVGPRQFEEMKRGAYFIAVSRGKLYSTEALVKALDSGRLAGAGLDVTNPEPLPHGHPLWKFENVVITPHRAGQSDLIMDRKVDLFKENIRRFISGGPMLNVVDKDKGY
jgi:phosphoglycerate dehydrogenase-like enzyme